MIRVLLAFSIFFIVSQLLFSEPVYAAGGWVLVPSIKLGVGYDDNVGMNIHNPPIEEISESSGVKATGEVLLRRNSVAHDFRGALLVDAISYLGNNNNENVEPNANQMLYFTTTSIKPRSRLGLKFNYRRDTLIREANVDDPTNPDDELVDVNQDASVDSFLDIGRQRILVNPFYKYNFSRRTDSTFNYRYSASVHDLSSGEDNASDDNPKDFQNQAISALIGHKITPIDRITGRTTYRLYSTENKADEYQTMGLFIGYQRSISPTFRVGGDLGYRETIISVQGKGDRSEAGHSGSLTAVKSSGLTRFELKGGVGLHPSSIGKVVQTQELVANVKRNLSELVAFSFRGRAYENTVLSSSGRNSNDRRSIELRAEITWLISRSWSAAAAYRYRREKLESKPTFSEGNSVLFAIKYTKVSPLSP